MQGSRFVRLAFAVDVNGLLMGQKKERYSREEYGLVVFLGKM